jgi:hypothetical protein
MQPRYCCPLQPYFLPHMPLEQSRHDCRAEREGPSDERGAPKHSFKIKNIKGEESS